VVFGGAGDGAIRNCDILNVDFGITGANSAGVLIESTSIAGADELGVSRGGTAVLTFISVRALSVASVLVQDYRRGLAATETPDVRVVDTFLSLGLTPPRDVPGAPPHPRQNGTAALVMSSTSLDFSRVTARGGAGITRPPNRVPAFGFEGKRAIALRSVRGLELAEFSEGVSIVASPAPTVVRAS
jgi:hypothetical protein